MAYRRMAELEAWMKHSGESVTGTQPAGWPEKSNVPSTRRGGRVYLHALPKIKDEMDLRDTNKPAPSHWQAATVFLREPHASCNDPGPGTKPVSGCRGDRSAERELG